MSDFYFEFNMTFEFPQSMVCWREEMKRSRDDVYVGSQLKRPIISLRGEP